MTASRRDGADEVGPAKFSYSYSVQRYSYSYSLSRSPSRRRRTAFFAAVGSVGGNRTSALENEYHVVEYK